MLAFQKKINALRANKQHQKAIDACLRELSKHPASEQNPIQQQLAIVYFEVGEFKKSLDASSCARPWGGQANILTLRAACYEQLKDFDNAVLMYRLIDNWQSNNFIILKLAQCYVRSQKHNVAKHIFDLIGDESYKTNASAVLAYAGMYESQGKDMEALEVYSKFWGGINGRYVGYKHAACLERLGRTSEALAKYEAMYLNYKDKKIILKLIPYYMEAKKYEEILKLLSQPQVKKLKGWTVLMARCRNGLGRYGQTINHLSKLKNCYDDVTIELALAYLGLARDEQFKDLKACKSHLRLALKTIEGVAQERSRPVRAQILNFQNHVEIQNKVEQAKMLVARAKSAQNGQAWSLYIKTALDMTEGIEDKSVMILRARILILQGHFHQALELLHSIPNEKTSASLVEHFADCYFGMRDYPAVVNLLSAHTLQFNHNSALLFKYIQALTAVGSFENALEWAQYGSNDLHRVECKLEELKLHILLNNSSDCVSVMREINQRPMFESLRPLASSLFSLRSFANLLRDPKILSRMGHSQVAMPDMFGRYIQEHYPDKDGVYLCGSALFDIINGDPMNTVTKPVDLVCFGQSNLGFKSQRDNGLHMLLPSEYAQWYESMLIPIHQVVEGESVPIEYKMTSDFTIGGLCCSPSGRLFDLTGLGLADLKAKYLRTAVDPNISLQGDNLRALRAIKYAAQGFRLAPDLIQAIKDWQPQPVEAVALFGRLQYDLSVLNDEHKELYISGCSTYGLSEKLIALFLSSNISIPLEIQRPCLELNMTPLFSKCNPKNAPLIRKLELEATTLGLEALNLEGLPNSASSSAYRLQVKS